MEYAKEEATPEQIARDKEMFEALIDDVIFGALEFADKAMDPDNKDPVDQGKAAICQSGMMLLNFRLSKVQYDQAAQRPQPDFAAILKSMGIPGTPPENQENIDADPID